MLVIVCSLYVDGRGTSSDKLHIYAELIGISMLVELHLVCVILHSGLSVPYASGEHGNEAFTDNKLIHPHPSSQDRLGSDRLSTTTICSTETHCLSATAE